METEKTIETILSIETGIQGGSLSLFANGIELDCWVGQTKISKAEDVLEQIKNIFERNKFRKESLKLIVVSNGPGSSTGLKIGHSLAKGLSKALYCEFIQIPVMESLMLKKQKMSEPVVIALPIGKDLISYQVFGDSLSHSEDVGLQVSGVKDFTRWVTERNFLQIVCHNDVYTRLSYDENLIAQISLINAGAKLASLMAVQVFNRFASDNVSSYNQLFIQN